MPNETSGGLTPASGGGSRFNTGKLRYSLVSVHALKELVKVLEFGAKKYDSWNWSKGLSWTECYDSLDRHMKAWLGGEDKDPETGLSHVAHAMCNAMFLVHFIITGAGRDDRPAAQKNINTKQEGAVGSKSITELYDEWVKRAEDEQRAKYDPYAYATGYGIPYNGDIILGAGTCVGGCGSQNSVESGRVSNLQTDLFAPTYEHPFSIYGRD